MTDQEIIQALINRDEHVTLLFFFVKCRPLFVSIIKLVYSYPFAYDEFVNELYQLLMEKEAYKLKQFDYRSTVFQWLKTVAIRHFINKRDKLIGDTSKEFLFPIVENSDSGDEARNAAKMDVDELLRGMSNQRYALVIRRLLIDEVEPIRVAEELGVTVDNLYNIKKRAMTALTQVARVDKMRYSYER